MDVGFRHHSDKLDLKVHNLAKAYLQDLVLDKWDLILKVPR